jgi:hypothetical protein
MRATVRARRDILILLSCLLVAPILASTAAGSSRRRRHHRRHRRQRRSHRGRTVGAHRATDTWPDRWARRQTRTATTSPTTPSPASHIASGSVRRVDPTRERMVRRPKLGHPRVRTRSTLSSRAHRSSARTRPSFPVDRSPAPSSARGSTRCPSRTFSYGVTATTTAMSARMRPSRQPTAPIASPASSRTRHCAYSSRRRSMELRTEWLDNSETRPSDTIEARGRDGERNAARGERSRGSVSSRCEAVEGSTGTAQSARRSTR